MVASAPDRKALLRFLPEERVGSVSGIEPITMGMSGASVWAVTASRGRFVLRIQAPNVDAAHFAQQLLVVERAAAASVAPAVVHVDEAARAVVSARIEGMPMAAALGDPAQRAAVLGSLVDGLRRLHALDASGVNERDPIPFAREAWDAARDRPGFPAWAVPLGVKIDAIEATLAHDPRRVVSHNDVNPVNVLWDGTRAWLVDWEVTGLTHPYYDLATLALFLRLEDNVALGLVERHDGAPLSERSRTTFHSLRQLAGMLCGLTFLGMVDDLSVSHAPTLAEAPTLGDVYAAMRRGELDMQSAHGKASFGLALLAESIASATSLH